jgi:recombination protein RecR
LIPKSLRKLVFELSKLPSIGERSAYRIAFHLLHKSKEDIFSLSEAIRDVANNLGWCRYCCGLSDSPVCDICSDHGRIKTQLCIVERPSDVFSLERSGAFRGLYHVLHGAWSPLKGISPEHLTFDRLFPRVLDLKEEDDPIEYPLEEIIIATSTTIEGDATALYIADELDQSGLHISRLAQGLPKGGELEYADEVTLGLSFSGRRKI